MTRQSTARQANIALVYRTLASQAHSAGKRRADKHYTHRANQAARRAQQQAALEGRKQPPQQPTERRTAPPWIEGTGEHISTVHADAIWQESENRRTA